MSARRGSGLGGLGGLALAASLALGCEAGFDEPWRPGAGGARPRCDDLGARLGVDPARAIAGAGQLLVLEPRGGTGQYRFSMLDAPSGGAVDPSRGLYVAGSRVGEEAIEDLVLLEDRGCAGEAVATVRVVAAPAIVPSRVEIEPGGALAFVGQGGSGEHRFELASSESGGSVEPDGSYRAGARLGRDVVRMQDDVLGASADAYVEVVADGSLRLAPTRWIVPLGAEVHLPIQGGSGVYRVEGGEAQIEATGGALRGRAAGSAELTVRDVHTDRTLAVAVTVAARHVVPREVPPDRTELHQVARAARDLTGDGLADAVVGHPRASVGAFRSGAVWVYPGTASGLADEPSIVLGGDRRDAELGRAIEVADLDGDGLADLVVSAPASSPTTSGNGAVLVYHGARDGLAREPATRFFGLAAGDRFGQSLAACDFDGDGRLDLAVGAPQAEDRGRSPVTNDQGGVFVFIAYPGGRFVSAPDQRLYGEMPGLGPVEGMRLGEGMVAGDFDGDGRCDLAVYATRPHADRSNWGAVLLYRGRAAGEGRGGLEPRPSLVWAPTDAASSVGRFGESLAMADVDGDGRAELLVGQRTRAGAAGSNAGALWLFRGRPLDGPAGSALEPPADAWWTVEGGREDQAGHRVALADVDGDGRPDVVSGESRASVEGVDATRPGAVRVFLGRAEGPGAEPWRVYTIPAANARFGLGLGVVRGLAGGGPAPLLVFAPYADLEPGDGRGALFLQPADASPPRRLVVPDRPAGQRVGASVALVELDGDAHPEVVVGAHGAIGAARQIDMGVVRVHRGSAGGAEPAPAQTLDDALPFRAAGNQLGFALAAAGRFDGTMRGYLAVLARQTSRPADLDDARFDVEPGCDGARTTAGAVYLFASRGDGTVEPDPAFVVFGPYTSGRLTAVAGGGDVDGDGFDDLLVGSREWSVAGNGAGGLMVVRGRARPGDGRIAIVCPSRVIDGPAGSRLGTAVSFVGDLGEGDGCHAFAAGAPDTGGTFAAQGALHVYSGFGPGCARPDAPESIVLLSGEANARAGNALAGGVDVDGDGHPELAVGMSRYRAGAGEVGRVFVLRGATLRALGWGTGPHRLAEPDPAFRAFVDGTSSGERLGSSLALVARAGQPALLIAGAPFGDASGVPLSGGVALYELGARGVAAAPWARVAGESAGRGELGDALAARFAAGRLYLSTGASWSRVDALDDGAAYSAGVAP
ncbi:MAG: FG-GAP repeat protein [Sandaracinaceae bacterium]|nr:FG-GAP repeat protein [Sandaracinaceae bacterium]